MLLEQPPICPEGYVVSHKLLLENTFNSLHIARALLKEFVKQHQNHLKCSITSLKPTPSKHDLINMHATEKNATHAVGRNIQSSYCEIEKLHHHR